MKKRYNELENPTNGQITPEMRQTNENHTNFQVGKRPQDRGRTAIWQSRLILLVMINLAQLWILSAAVEAALAREFRQLLPLVISSGVCWLIALSIYLWWKPAVRRRGTSGFLREK